MAAPMRRKFCSLFSSFLCKYSNFGKCHSTRARSLSRYVSSFCKRSHMCGELRAAHIGEHVQLKGWVHHVRFGVFLVLRDACGLVQLVIPPDKTDLIKSLSLESVVAVEGVVASRKLGEENKNMPTGEVEVVVSSVDVISTAKTVPFNTRHYDKVKEALRLEYRYLDLRTQAMQTNLRRRSEFIHKIRHHLCQKNGFVEVETPTLFRRTPGGAREFIVPTHQPGKFYSLPQSPQQFKQLLMIGGLDRYMQIARCYRDESHRPDRQPEFTQLDVEMSFVDANDVMNLIEEMLMTSWPEERQTRRQPFVRMTYDDVINKYGTDKPDIRLGMEIHDVTDTMSTSVLDTFARLGDTSQTARALVVKQADALKKKDLAAIQECSSRNAYITTLRIRGETNWQGAIANQLSSNIRSSLLESLNLQPTDVVVIACGERRHTLATLGKIRLQLADWLESRGHVTRGEDSWLWVTDFPLFETVADGRLQSCHHPFTAPHPADAELIYTNPENVRGLHYDLVLNGNEVGGGSIRIHDAELQRYVLETILREDTSELRHLLEALEYGAPPHGGIALGLDRLCAIMCDVTSIRDVIAFPKSLDGKDLMSKSPATVSQSELDYYNILSRDDYS